MTDLLTENARLRAALRACAEIAKWTPKHPACEKVIAEVDTALATPASDAVQDAARVERVACAMWKAEADRASPNVGRNRTPEMFANELHDTRAKWLGLADAALRAIAGDRT